MPTTEEVPAEPRVQPKIGKILDLLAPNGEIDNAQKKQQSAMSELGVIYKTVEKDLHGNHAAVAFIRKLDKMDADKRSDLIRTLEPLLVERGYTLDAIDPDLADMTGGKDANQGDDDDDGEKGDNSVLSGLDKARQHLTGGAANGDAEPVAPPPPKKVNKPKLGIVPGGTGTVQ